MKLADWLSTTGTSAATLAKRCGVHTMTVYKWKDGTNVPRHHRLAALTEATAGVVTANDFHESSTGAETYAGGALASLLLEAEALGLDGQAVCEAALRSAIRAAKADKWQGENRDAIEAHARYVEEHGLPLEKFRMF
jgi:antitoxin CcdA